MLERIKYANLQSISLCSPYVSTRKYFFCTSIKYLLIEQVVEYLGNLFKNISTAMNYQLLSLDVRYHERLKLLEWVVVMLIPKLNMDTGGIRKLDREETYCHFCFG